VASVFAFAVLLSATAMGSDTPSSGRTAMMSPKFNPSVVSGGLINAANTSGNSGDVFEPDSVSVIDLQNSSNTRFQVVHTV
jgi:hypothetical protein